MKPNKPEVHECLRCSAHGQEPNANEYCHECGGHRRVVGVREGVHTLITADGRVMEFDAMDLPDAAGIFEGWQYENCPSDARKDLGVDEDVTTAVVSLLAKGE